MINFGLFTAAPLSGYFLAGAQPGVLPPLTDPFPRRALASGKTLSQSPHTVSVAGGAGRGFFLTPYAKRFTRWSHLLLGLALGIAPLAAWIAVRGSLDPRTLALTGAVLFWVQGSTSSMRARIMSTMWVGRPHGIPQAFGLDAAFWIARFMIWRCLLYWPLSSHSFTSASSPSPES